MKNEIAAKGENMTTAETTPLEDKIMLCILINEMNEYNCSLPKDASGTLTYADSIYVSPYFQGIELLQIGGIVSSLAKKGLASASGKGLDATTCLTEEGYSRAKILYEADPRS